MSCDRTRIIYRRTPESAAMLANVKRAMAITAALNRLTFNDADEVRALFSDLIGQKVDDNFLLIPPFYTAGGDEIRVGKNVFVNQNCTFYDLGGLDIADDVMIGPKVSLIHGGPSPRPVAAPCCHDRKAHRDREERLDRGRRDDHRRGDGRRELGRGGGVGRHQGCSAEHSRRRKSRAGHSFDRRRLKRRRHAGEFMLNCLRDHGGQR